MKSLVSKLMFILVVMLGVKESQQMLRGLMDPRGPPKGPPRRPPRGPPKGPRRGPPGGPPIKPANRTCNITKMSKLVADHFTFEKRKCWFDFKLKSYPANRPGTRISYCIRSLFVPVHTKELGKNDLCSTLGKLRNFFLN